MRLRGVAADRGRHVKDSPSGLMHRTVASMAWVAWGSGAVALLKVMVLVLLTRLLSPADFGLVGAALVVVTFSLNFSQLGLGRRWFTVPPPAPPHQQRVLRLDGIGAPGRRDRLARGSAHRPVLPYGAPHAGRALALVFPIAGLAATPRACSSATSASACWPTATYSPTESGTVQWASARPSRLGVWALVVAHLTQVTLRTAILLRAAPPLLPARPPGEFHGAHGLRRGAEHRPRRCHPGQPG